MRRLLETYERQELEARSSITWSEKFVDMTKVVVHARNCVESRRQVGTRKHLLHTLFISYHIYATISERLKVRSKCQFPFGDQFDPVGSNL